MRIELTTSTLARLRSTAELRPLICAAIFAAVHEAEANIGTHSEFASFSSYMLNMALQGQQAA